MFNGALRTCAALNSKQIRNIECTVYVRAYGVTSVRDKCNKRNNVVGERVQKRSKSLTSKSLAGPYHLRRQSSAILLFYIDREGPCASSLFQTAAHRRKIVFTVSTCRHDERADVVTLVFSREQTYPCFVWFADTTQ
eukprot:1183044-Prorocentrum_minimum.AAC.3